MRGEIQGSFPSGHQLNSAGGSAIAATTSQHLNRAGGSAGKKLYGNSRGAKGSRYPRYGDAGPERRANRRKVGSRSSLFEELHVAFSERGAGAKKEFEGKRDPRPSVWGTPTGDWRLNSFHPFIPAPNPSFRLGTLLSTILSSFMGGKKNPRQSN